MKKAILFPLLAVASFAETAEQRAAVPLTLDPSLYAEALREVQGGAPPASPANQPQSDEASASAAAESSCETAARTPVSSAPGVEDWQAAMRDAGTELADVRLLVLLQRLNPLEPPSARAEDYAEALRLHHLMLAGNARACLALARACRDGHFESGLVFVQSEALACVLEQRAAAFHLLTPMDSAPRAQQPGASE